MLVIGRGVTEAGVTEQRTEGEFVLPESGPQ